LGYFIIASCFLLYAAKVCSLSFVVITCVLSYSVLRFMGYKKTVLLDRKLIVELVDRYTNGSLQWDEFSALIKVAHTKRMGSASKRMVIPDRPKEEDYFYANPQECLQDRYLLQNS
jgi:rhamnogalacturonan I rhamnosyltransferase